MKILTDHPEDELSKVCLFDRRRLNNSYGFEKYISGKHQIDRLKKDSKSPQKIIEPNIQHPLFTKTEVVWICLTYPLCSLLGGVCSAVAITLNSIWIREYAVFFEVASKQFTRKWNQLTDYWVSQKSLLVSAANYPRLDCKDVYMQRPYNCAQLDPDLEKFFPRFAIINKVIKSHLEPFIKNTKEKISRQRKLLNFFYFFSFSPPTPSIESLQKEFMKDPKNLFEKNLKALATGDQEKKGINTLYAKLVEQRQKAFSCKTFDFYHPQGDSQGASIWFIYLFLKSKVHFNDRTKHMIATAKKFQEGVPGQAIVLQGLKDTAAKLLNEKTKEMKDHTISYCELENSYKICLEKINLLPKGIYQVRVLGHSLVFCKDSSEKAMVWDPEFGLYKKDADEFLDHILNYYHESKNPKSQVYFTLVESRSLT